ncbi:MAG: hypothetical protein ACLR8Y_00140 [Alistipes indistinctus]
MPETWSTEWIPHGPQLQCAADDLHYSHGSCTPAQAQEYVPHEFVAVTDVGGSQVAVKEPGRQPKT